MKKIITILSAGIIIVSGYFWARMPPQVSEKFITVAEADISSSAAHISLLQRRWQRAKKLKSLGSFALLDCWLTNDPNYFCADLDFNKQVNFHDYATFLRYFK